MGKIEWGKIVGTHGVRGELKVLPWLDFMSLSQKVEALAIDDKQYKVLSTRSHKGMILLMLEGVDSMNKAELFRDKILYTSRDDIDLGEGHFFYSDIVGFEVFDETTNQIIGKLKAIEEYPSSDVYVITGDKRDVLIPLVPQFDRGIDLENKRITVATIGGMLDDED